MSPTLIWSPIFFSHLPMMQDSTVMPALGITTAEMCWGMGAAALAGAGAGALAAGAVAGAGALSAGAAGASAPPGRRAETSSPLVPTAQTLVRQGTSSPSWKKISSSSPSAVDSHSKAALSVS